MSVVGFGKDLACTDRIRTGQFVTGARLVAEAAFRRITTPRGTLRGGEEEASYGLDLTEIIGSVQSDSDVVALQGRVRGELLKDDRIVTVDVTAKRTNVGPSVELEITIEATTKEGPFALTVSVDEVSVELLGISVEAA